MNQETPFKTAWARAVYWAAGSGLLTGLTTWSATDDGKVIIIAAGTAALVALGFRGGIEGRSDQARHDAGRVKPGDVGQ